MSEIDLGQEFENNFDCYADMEKDTFKPIDTHLAMTKVKFIEVVSKLLVANGAKQLHLKALPIRDVSQQRELLVAYANWENEQLLKGAEFESHEDAIEIFLTTQ